MTLPQAPQPTTRSVQIVSVRQSPSADPARRNDQDTVVYYVIAATTADWLAIPKANPSKEEVQKAVEAHIKARHPAAGHTFEV
jgi:hypothetical protein